MKLAAVDWLLWLAWIASTLSLTFWIYRSAHRKRFPVFSALIAYRGLKSVLLVVLLLASGYTAYFYAFWINAVVQYVWLWLVLIELAGQVVAPYGPIKREWATRVAALVAVASSGAAFITGSTHVAISLKLEAVLQRADASVTFAWIAAFIVLAGISSWMGFGWRKTENGIAAGLFIEMIAAACADILYQKYGFKLAHDAGVIQQTLALLSFAPWFVAFKSSSQTQSSISLDVVASTLNSLETRLSPVRKS